jgi:hypothetical protein
MLHHTATHWPVWSGSEGLAFLSDTAWCLIMQWHLGSGFFQTERDGTGRFCIVYGFLFPESAGKT